MSVFSTLVVAASIITSPLNVDAASAPKHIDSVKVSQAHADNDETFQIAQDAYALTPEKEAILNNVQNSDNDEFYQQLYQQ